MTKTEKQKCSWGRCKENIEVEQSDNDFLHVIGWCDFHHKVYSKQCELFTKMGGKHHSDISNELYINNRKKYNEVQRKATKLVKLEMKINAS